MGTGVEVCGWLGLLLVCGCVGPGGAKQGGRSGGAVLGKRKKHSGDEEMIAQKNDRPDAAD